MIDKPPAVEQAAPSEQPLRRATSPSEPLTVIRRSLERVRRIRDDLADEVAHTFSEYPGSA